VRVTLSIGIACFPQDTKNMDELMKLADDALYKAKREGKNRIVVT
jgi:diguanylate cyclase (GGDEF)-like protein